MPGRQSPRRPLGAAQGTHLHGAFSGALDGASTLPAPVGEDGAAGRDRKSPQVYFHQQEFTASGGAQSVALTFLPLAHSEHVYLCRQGASGGEYQPEGSAWQREAGKRDLKVLTGMNARLGDVVVVEYAYHEQVGLPGKCGLVYPDVVQADSPSFQVLPLEDVYGSYEVLPPPTGYPDIVVGGDRGHPDNWRARWVLEYWDPAEYVMDVVSGIAPGSSYARRLRHPDNIRLNTPGETITLETGPQGRLRLFEASYFGSSVWLELVDLGPVTNPVAVLGNVVIGYSVAWKAGGIWGSAGAKLWFNRSQTQEYWDLYSWVQLPGGVRSSIPFAVLPGVTTMASDPGPRCYSLMVDCPTRTLSIGIGDETATFSGDAVWPSSEELAKQDFSMTDEAWDYEVDGFSGAPWPIMSHTIDQLRISTDAPYCVWSDGAAPAQVLMELDRPTRERTPLHRTRIVGEEPY